MPKRNLRDLAKEGLIKLPTAFGGSFSGMEVFDSGQPKVLRGFERNKLGIKITCEWKGGSGSAHIRSEDKDLLDEIETILTGWIGKYLDEIYAEKF